MEALNKLERLVQLPFMEKVKVEEIKWHSFKVSELRGYYIDAYYTINNTNSNGTCDEFKSTLANSLTSDFRCRKVGEERSRQFSNKTVVKLELYYRVPHYAFITEGSKYLTFATKIRTLQGKCLYPVQVRPDTSFYEPSNYDWPERGYSFNVYILRNIKVEPKTMDICRAIKKRSELQIKICNVTTSEAPKVVRIVTDETQDGVLNVMTQLMEELNDENPISCTTNIALPVISKKISEP
ncbi:unnamed protein product [Dicrocoelium dendriticum]|nr:unnamed protein product [Dicrocoelium dendriticum]